MNEKPGCFFSILKGFITALALYAALMYPAGGAYMLAKGWCSPFLLHSLFYCQFLPNLFITAFISGVAMGSIKAGGPLACVRCRGAITTVTSCLIICLVTFRLFLGAWPSTARDAAAWLALSLTSSLILIAPVIAGAMLGKSWTGKDSLHIRKRVLFTFIVGLVLIIGQGTAVKRAISRYEQTVPGVSAEISRNLAALSPEDEWLPLFQTYIYPRLCGVRRGDMLVGSRIDADLTRSGRLNSAHMRILTVVNERDKRSVSRTLLENRVRPSMVEHLKWDRGWYAKCGRYSVSIMDH